MILPITWMQYLKAIGIIALLYYVIVLALFFRSDVKKILSERLRKKKTLEEGNNAG